MVENMKKHKALEQKIIEEAQRIFSRFGFKKTTMEDIARALFKAKSSLYHYFGSKEEIYKAVVEKEATAVRKEIAHALAAQDSPVEKLESYVLTRMRAIHRLANFYHAFRSEYLDAYGFIQKIRQDYDRYEVQTIKGILKEGIKRGFFSVEDLELTAVAIITAIKGFEYPWAVAQDLEKIERDIRTLLHVLFCGIMKR